MSAAITQILSDTAFLSIVGILAMLTVIGGTAILKALIEDFTFIIAYVIITLVVSLVLAIVGYYLELPIGG